VYGIFPLPAGEAFASWEKPLEEQRVPEFSGSFQGFRPSKASGQSGENFRVPLSPTVWFPGTGCTGWRNVQRLPAFFLGKYFPPGGYVWDFGEHFGGVLLSLSYVGRLRKVAFYR
jgi:hypothetical protein